MSARKDPNRPCPDCGTTDISNFDFDLPKSVHHEPCRRFRCRECLKIHSRKRYRANNRHSQLVSEYGITEFQYNLMLKSQNGVCFICKEPPGIKSLHVDHCHETNIIRGLLCSKCNTAIGSFKHSPALLRVAADYLERSK